MKVEIWSDFACPFCYLGDKKFEMALAEFENKEQVEIEFKSFQLDVHATSHPGEDIHALISKKYGISYEQAKASNDQIIKAAKEVGLQYDFDILKPNNTGLAHEVAKYAAHMGKEKVLVERFFKAYFEEGVDLGIKENLLKLAGEVGIDENELNVVLDKGIYKEAVIKDQEKASDLGIQGVPFFVLDGRYGISGAQSVEHFKMVLDKAFIEEA